MEEYVGTIISTMDSPSPGGMSFVVTKGNVHRGQFVEAQYPEGTMVALITNVVKTNRYFERADSVKEFEARGSALFEQFPTSEWEYLIAQTKPLGVFNAGMVSRASFPPSPGTRVRTAQPGTLEKFFKFDKEKGVHLGRVEFHDLDVNLNLTKLLKKHLAILSISGAGKCVSPHSRVLLNDGRNVEIGGLVEQHLAKQSVIEDGIEISYSNPDGLEVFSLGKTNQITPSKIRAFTRRKAPGEMLKIHTRSGRILEVTKEHPLPVMNGSIEWIPASGLGERNHLLISRPRVKGSNKQIDCIDLWEDSKKVRAKDKEVLDLIRKKITEKASLKSFAKTHSIPYRTIQNWLKESGIPLFYLEKLCAFTEIDFNQLRKKIKTLGYGKRTIPSILSVNKDFARLLGYLLAEGHNNAKMMSFINNCPEIQEDFAGLCKQVFKEKACRIKRENEVRLYNKLLAETLQRIGFTNSSWTKFVPDEILMSEEKVACAFLSSFFDCDGYVSSAKSEAEICLASKRLVEGINQILLRLGIVAFKKVKMVNSKPYPRLFIRGSKNLSIFEKHLSLIIDMKKERLEKHIKKQSNPNFDTIPNTANQIKKLLELLRIGPSQTRSKGILNYLHRHDNPSLESLNTLLNTLENRFSELELTTASIKKLFYSLPNSTEDEAKEIVADAYGNFDFNQIASGSGISSTTARRVVRGITNPKNSVFRLAENALVLQGKSDLCIEGINNLDFNKVATNIKRLSEKLNYSTQELCVNAGAWKRALYTYSEITCTPSYSFLYSIAKCLFKESLRIEKSLPEARQHLNSLKSIAHSNLYFDQITKIEKFKPDYEYVYDLCVEDHNFVCEDLVIHNSYATSVLFEELLDRKKEHGRIATIVLDPHGEYSSFAQPVKDKKHKDYSNRTLVVKGRNVRISVPSLSVGILAGIIPGLSGAQKRDLNRIISKLKEEMKSGLGPFDFERLKKAISEDKQVKENTKGPLIGWLSELEGMRLFSKTDSPSIRDIVRPGYLTVIDLSDIINIRKKQVIVSHFAHKLFNARRKKLIPPFLVVLEEAHQFVPMMVSKEQAVSRNIIRTIAREGRKFGAALCLISQRPIQLDTTALSQCNSKIILRITNPYDLKHIAESAEAIDQRSMDLITSLQVGEALIIGEAVNYPLFLKIRERRSLPSKHEISLEEAAVQFEESKKEKDKETEAFL